MQESSRAGWGRGSSRERTGCSEKGLPQHLSVELLDDLLDVDHELPVENSWNGAKRVKRGGRWICSVSTDLTTVFQR